MSKIKEITVFTNGDSTKLSTWSNVPYFFTQTLIEKGIKVNRVDLSPDKVLQDRWNKTMGRVLRRVLKNHTEYNYFRSKSHFDDVKKRIEKALKDFPNADANLFLTFSFSSAGMSDKPTVLFCDWTYDHLFRYYANRQPAWLERKCLERENAQIEGADLVLPLYPAVAVYMKKTYCNKNIFYLGNVINSMYEAKEAEMLSAKKNSQDLIFVGSAKYIEGAKTLVQAFKNLRNDFKELKLHIVGITEQELGEKAEGLTCYGYLDKANDEQRNFYYSLLKNAKVFVNTTPKWGAFSATIEAMYFYTPVLVTAYEEFVETFGREIGFGKFCHENSAFEIEKNLRALFSANDYDKMCVKSNEAVKDFTWSAYVDKMLKKIEEIRM